MAVSYSGWLFIVFTLNCVSSEFIQLLKTGSGSSARWSLSPRFEFQCSSCGNSTVEIGSLPCEGQTLSELRSDCQKKSLEACRTALEGGYDSMVGECTLEQTPDVLRIPYTCIEDFVSSNYIQLKKTPSGSSGRLSLTSKCVFPCSVNGNRTVEIGTLPCGSPALFNLRSDCHNKRVETCLTALGHGYDTLFGDCSQELTPEELRIPYTCIGAITTTTTSGSDLPTTITVSGGRIKSPTMMLVGFLSIFVSLNHYLLKDC